MAADYYRIAAEAYLLTLTDRAELVPGLEREVRGMAKQFRRLTIPELIPHLDKMQRAAETARHAVARAAAGELGALVEIRTDEAGNITAKDIAQ